MSLTKVSYSMINGISVNVLDYGAHSTDDAGYSTFDSTTAIQAAIDYVSSLKNKGTVIFPVGKYKITSAITVSSPNVSLIGLGTPSAGPGDSFSVAGRVTRGATLRYYGSTGAALIIGIDPNGANDYLDGISVQNFRIEVDNDTPIAMQVWCAYNSYFKNISIFGNKGVGTVGLQVNSGINNIFEQIFVNGQGQTAAVGYTNCVAIGLKAIGSTGGNPATTTVFRRCYFSYCNFGTSTESLYDFEDCIWESCQRGFVGAILIGQLLRPYFEANIECDLQINGGRVQIVGGRIDSYSRQIFMFADSIEKLILDGVSFRTTNANPILFPTTSNVTSSNGVIKISNCDFSSNTKVGGIANTAPNTYPRVLLTDQSISAYRFVFSPVTASYSALIPTEGGFANNAYILPSVGNIVAVNSWYTGSMAGGNYTVTVKKDASTLSDFSATSTVSQQVMRGDALLNPVVQGSSLTVQVATTVINGGDLIVEVLIAEGKNGIL